MCSTATCDGDGLTPGQAGFDPVVGVFVDTMIICTATAFIILVSGPGIYDPSTPTRVEGATLTQAAIADGLGAWTISLVTVLVFVFAYSSVLGNYAYAEINLFFLGARRSAINIFRVAVLIAIAVGALSELTPVWTLADLAMGLMALVNLIAICLLGKWAFAAIKDYHRQTDAGADPVFVADEAGLPGTLDGDIWTRSAPKPADVGHVS